VAFLVALQALAAWYIAMFFPWAAILRTGKRKKFVTLSMMRAAVLKVLPVQWLKVRPAFRNIVFCSLRTWLVSVPTIPSTRIVLICPVIQIQAIARNLAAAGAVVTLPAIRAGAVLLLRPVRVGSLVTGNMIIEIVYTV
jgi:hypothetical protein